jgi:hypothetical protein
MPLGLLTEEFAGRDGFADYEAYDPDENDGIHSLKHVDIRVFESEALTTPLTLALLSTMTLTELDTMTMDELAGDYTVREAEQWTNGTVGYLGVGELRGLSLTLAGPTTETESVDVDFPVNILAGFADTDHVSITLPNWPGLDPSDCYLDLTSNPEGDFTAGPTISVSFAQSVVPVVAGDSEMRVPRSAFAGLNLANITGVRLRFAGAGTVTVGAIRLLPPEWTYGKMDVDNRYGRFRQVWDRSGAFVMPFAWPEPMYRTYLENDPTPIDAEMAVIFHSGSASANNEIALYFRETRKTYPTQADLNGDLMSELDGPNQPDIGIDGSNSAYVRFGLNWGGGGVDVLSILNNKGDGYEEIGITDLAADTHYILFTRLEGTKAQATLREYDPTSGTVGAVHWDSGEVGDPGWYPRRKGRFGWYANINDTDAWVESITERSTLYAEYRSRAYASQTPAIGAELFVGQSPVVEQFENLAPGPYNVPDAALLERDAVRSISGSSWRLTNFGTAGVQGIQTNPFALVNFEESEITFDLFVESDPGLSAYLMSPDKTQTHELLVPNIVPGRWQNVRLFFPFDQDTLTGTYKLVLTQVAATVATWWVDNFHIRTRTVSWWGRSVKESPWGDNYAPWTPFYDNINRDSSGILFPLGARGRNLQVRARAVTNDAYIDRIQTKPKYQELGNLIFPRPVAVTGGVGSGVELEDGTIVVPPFADFTWEVV